MSAPRLILASASPRRVALLAQIGVTADAVDAADIDESVFGNERPADHAARLAWAKAAIVAGRHPHAVVLGADTVVAVGRRILPKAESDAQVGACLDLLSGRRHDVLTAVTVIDVVGNARHRMSTTTVIFKRLSSAEIDSYTASGEGLGKAGGYAIQGRAEALVRRVQGSWSGVVGLPLFETRGLLLGAGIDV
ncbi:MAG TPA: Maf family nucleotide pyrophosphatase [Polymorphobacter sp.]|nr:Maf family nucleotide pyrophosphatase [Polymorphobacter sp.]